MSLNPLSEARYRYKLAMNHLERAERLFSARDWVGVVSASQLAVENFAKAIIATMEVPTWSHDPSNQLKNLMERFPSNLKNKVDELATMAREMAPEHGRSTYGEPTLGLLPSDIYGEDHASAALGSARKARRIAESALKKLGIEKLNT